MNRSPSSSSNSPQFPKLTPFLHPLASCSLLVAVAATGLACGASDDPLTANGGQSPGGGGAVAGSPAGGAGSGSAGVSASGGTVGIAGSGVAGSGVAGSGVAGSGIAGSGAAGAPAATAGSGGSIAGAGNVAGASGSAGMGAAGSGGAGATHWVGTWAASPYAAGSNGPPAPLANSVLRQITHASLGGKQIRVQFSNKVGDGPVVIKAAHVALCKATPKVDSSIDITTDKALTFSGMPGVTIAQGMEVWSDPVVDFNLPALGNVTITTALGSVPNTLTSHAGARTNSYVVAGSTDVSLASLPSTTPKNLHWFFISGIDVMAPAAARAAVAIGDSITDGRGTTDDGNDRWTDILAARLQANPATAHISVLNQGIGATKLMGTGDSAEARFARDVLGQSAVKYAIIFDGVNDINDSNPDGSTLTAMKATYDKLIKAARDKSLLVYGGTILPFGANAPPLAPTGGFYTAAHETLRQQLNTYIKSGVFDGVIDFDAALTDGGNPPKLPDAFADWSQKDGLHPGPAGYKKMGDSVDLMLFTK